MPYENQSEGSKSLNQREHNDDADAKRTVVRGLNPDDGLWYNVSVVESSDTPGVFGLVILNADGSSVSSGVPVDTTDNYLLETGDAVLLETGDLILIE